MQKAVWPFHGATDLEPIVLRLDDIATDMQKRPVHQVIERLKVLNIFNEALYRCLPVNVEVLNVK